MHRMNKVMIMIIIVNFTIIVRTFMIGMILHLSKASAGHACEKKYFFCVDDNVEKPIAFKLDSQICMT